MRSDDDAILLWSARIGWSVLLAVSLAAAGIHVYSNAQVGMEVFGLIALLLLAGFIADAAWRARAATLNVRLAKTGSEDLRACVLRIYAGMAIVAVFLVLPQVLVPLGVHIAVWVAIAFALPGMFCLLSVFRLVLLWNRAG